MKKIFLAVALAAASVNANAAEGVCSPPPRGNLSLCRQLESALQTFQATFQPMAPKAERQAMLVGLGLIGWQVYRLAHSPDR